MGLNTTNDDVVISGISGRFPESENMEEFKQNLFAGVDLITEDPRRWPTNTYGLPNRTGKLKNLSHFDASFFGIHSKQAHFMDPQLRMLLELTHEAIVDAGINPSEIRGTNTGVFIGVLLNESLEHWSEDVETINGYTVTGCTRTMFPNRISYSFDFRGPSYSIDTACSSSLYALQQAFVAIKTGQCDAAIVGGINLLLHPKTTLYFHKMNMSNPEGMCKTFDSSANGYVRAEANAVIYLQRASSAKRIYATVLGAKTNADGYKNLGITYPAGLVQNQLLRETYEEFGVDYQELSYLEAHGTGTKAGDPQECNAVADYFCVNRKEPLLIGSVKSNMGHSESASGLCSIAKVVIAMESGKIPANLHYKEANKDIPGLTDGRLKVVSKNHPWNGGVVGVSGFGFGGANAHIILRSNTKAKPLYPPNSILRLTGVSGRTPEAVQNFLSKLYQYKSDAELLALVDSIHSKNIPGHTFRGYSILTNPPITEVVKVSSDKRPVWFVYSGLGSNWPTMAKDLMKIDQFKASIEKCSDILKPYNINLEDILINSTEDTFDNMLTIFISIVTMQIALTDLLTFIGIEPDGIIGHSVGEIGCAYADGTLTAEQAILAAYFRGIALLETNFGAMAAVGLSYEECNKYCPSDVSVACHNSADNVTVSGPIESINKFVVDLTSKNIFARVVKGTKNAFHSKYIAQAGPKLRKALETVIPHPKTRSHKWISSSIPERDWNTHLAQESSPAYHVNNFLSPVLFHEASQHIPENAILIEIAPNALMLSNLRGTVGPDAVYISLVKRGHEDNVKYLLSSIGKIYGAGAQPKLSNLYSPVSFPVGRGTPMINSMIEWDHSTDWMVPSYNNKASRSGELVIDIDLSEEEYQFLKGHKIDGRIIFPVAGYLTLVWKTFAKLHNEDFEQFPVIIENVELYQPTVMPEEGSVKFSINILVITGEFEISEGGSALISGKIYVPEDINKEILNMDTPKKVFDRNLIPLTSSDIYKELRLRGYEYDREFKGVIECDNYGLTGKLQWNKNWITFIDTMLHFALISKETRELYLPVRFNKVIINPKSHLQLIKEDTISVQMNRDSDILQSGAIEFRGIKLNLGQRRKQLAGVLLLEKQYFIPLVSNIQLNKDEETAKIDTLKTFFHLVLENNSGSRKFSIAEIAFDSRVERLLSPTLQKISDKETNTRIDLTVVSPMAIDTTNIDTAKIKVLQKDIITEKTEKRYHLLVLPNLFTGKNFEILNKGLSSLLPGGFILSEDLNKPFDEREVAKMNLEIISQHRVGNKHYVLLRKPVEISLDDIIINVTETNFNWLEPLKNAMRKSEQDNSKIYLFTQAEELNGLIGLVNCIIQEPGGGNIRSVFIHDSNAEEFSLMSNMYKQQLRKDLIHNVLKDGVWGTFKHLYLEPMPLSEVEHAYIDTLNRGDLASLQWIESPLKYQAINNNLKLVSVAYASLNFHDIMLATGKLAPDVIPGNFTSNDSILGMEFSGHDANGGRVMGMIGAKALATTVLADPGFLWKIPNTWNFEQAATIPLAYGTSYYALIIRGQMRPGESVLIHAGSGGLGQASITIALSMGCNVFTTVSSQAKRNFLKNQFPKLSNEQIGYSRDTSFEQLVLSKTNGRGVDLVLNSLATHQQQASIRCLAVGGRFLEVGKVDMAKNASLGMEIFLKNIIFSAVHLDALFGESIDCFEKREIVRLVSEGIESGVVIPLPTTIFSENEVEKAFRFMASGKHIGKVLLKIRGEETMAYNNPTIKTVTAVRRTYMNPNKTYILVGGLGGIGLELANWLIERGATKVVITTRMGIRTGYQSLCVRRWRQLGANVFIAIADVSCETEAKKLLNDANEMGPIGGIFNLAAVLSDALMENQTEANFKTACKAKVLTTKILDKLSRTMAKELDYFVAFSSFYCGRGNPSQSTYSFANSVMERICEARKAAGFPGLAIQWGAIADVGIVVDVLGNVEELSGTIPQSISSCLITIDMLLQVPYAVVGSVVIIDKDKHMKGVSDRSVTDTVSNILGIKDINTVPSTSTLADLGIDSLMSAELKETLQRSYGLPLNVQEIRDLTFNRLRELSSDENGPVNNHL